MYPVAFFVMVLALIFTFVVAVWIGPGGVARDDGTGRRLGRGRTYFPTLCLFFLFLALFLNMWLQKGTPVVWH